MTITLRSVKGSPLTHEELDGNFTDLDGRVDLKSDSGHTHDYSEILNTPVMPAFLTYFKDADTSRTNSVAFVDDPDLVSATLEANSMYRVELLLMTKSDANTDLRFRVSRTGLSDAELYMAGDLDNAVATVITWNTTQNLAGSGVAALRMGNYIGYLRTGSEAGAVVIQWGQQTVGAGESILGRGSMLMLRKVG